MAKSAAISLALLVFLSSCVSAPEQRKRRDGFFIENAAFADPGYLKKLDVHAKGAFAKGVFDPNPTSMGLFAHRLVTGAGTIFGYRSYSPGGLLTIDDETFEKVTIWLGQPLPIRGKIPIDDSVLAVYTKGGSAWPDSACSGVITKGSIQVSPRGDAFDVSIAGDLVELGSRRPQSCVERHLQVSFKAVEISVASLTPWLGRAGDYPYAESYPH